MRDWASTITERLYDGITNPGDWHAALDALRQATEGSVFHHVAYSHQAQCVVSSLVNDAQPAARVREYELHYASSDPRIPIVMALPVGGVLLDHEHFSPRDMSRSAIYADWLAPLGYRHTLGVPVYDDGTLREWVCVMRERGQRPFGDETQTLLNALMPDLPRASRLRVRWPAWPSKPPWGWRRWTRCPRPWRWPTPAANCATPTPPRSACWRRAVLGACAMAACVPTAPPCKSACNASSRPPASVQKTWGGYKPAASTLHSPHNPAAAMLHVLPLHPGHPLAQVHAQRPHALLVWARGPASPRVPELAAALGLTDTEARLALALAQGLSLKDLAQAQGCSWHTARTHTKNLLHTTGLHRQHDVALLVRGLLPG